MKAEAVSEPEWLLDAQKHVDCINRLDGITAELIVNESRTDCRIQLTEHGLSIEVKVSHSLVGALCDQALAQTRPT